MPRIKMIYWIIAIILLLITNLSFGVEKGTQPAWYTYSVLFILGVGFFVQMMIPLNHYKKLQEGKKSTKFAAWCSVWVGKK